MKKLLALAILCLMMALSLTPALAEAAVVETLYDGVCVQFEDGFELYLPANWVQFECSEEMLANGIFYMAVTEDQSYLCTLAWMELAGDLTIAQLQETLAATYETAEVIEVNDVGLVMFADVENSSLCFAALDGTEPGCYLFTFTPMDDEDFATVAALIASSIRNL